MRLLGVTSAWPEHKMHTGVPVDLFHCSYLETKKNSLSNNKTAGLSITNVVKYGSLAFSIKQKRNRNLNAMGLYHTFSTPSVYRAYQLALILC